MSLEKLQVTAAQARDLTIQVAELEEQIKSLTKRLHLLYHETMPMMMDDIGVDHVGVAPEGNKPGIDFKLQSFFSASIAAAWPIEKKEEAYAVLKRLKAESLIKTEVSARLPKGNLQLAKKLIAAAKKLGIVTEFKQSVHAGTLTAWLREIYDRGQQISDTDKEKLGAFVGRIVRPQERKT